MPALENLDKNPALYRGARALPSRIRATQLQLRRAKFVVTRRCDYIDSQVESGLLPGVCRGAYRARGAQVLATAARGPQEPPTVHRRMHRKPADKRRRTWRAESRAETKQQRQECAGRGDLELKLLLAVHGNGAPGTEKAHAEAGSETQPAEPDRSRYVELGERG